ncbi:MAG: GNAT family N-acetyltransferase [Candidatus Gracilibacteria bacterium]|nr:GNAT family N-acetyltransferase [Candidatus Gracilibacteria bacterium]
MLELINPTEAHREDWENIMGEWNDDRNESDNNRKRPRILFQDTFDKFLAIVEELGLSNDEVRQMAKSSVMFLVDSGENRVLGCSWIRHHIQFSLDALYNGHIGYGIRPSERGQGYATEILKLSLLEAKKIGLDKILIACDDTNVASARVIEKNGGVFESFNNEDGVKRRRYWIDIV